MAQIKVTLTNIDGEVLEQLIVESDIAGICNNLATDTPLKLAKLVQDVIEINFETKEV